VFEFDGIDSWFQDQKLTASDRAQNDQFGTSVSLSGEWALIGAAGDDTNRGSAYLFRDNTTAWLEVDKLTASDRAAGDRFGTSVNVSGGRAVIGASGDAPGGSAYLFDHNGFGAWNPVNKLTASDSGSGDQFGYAVSLSGDRALIGARYDDEPNGQDSGSAYVVTDLLALFIDGFEDTP
jgi:hypothetical protein